LTTSSGSGLTGIGNYAFSYCSSLTSIDLPEGLTSIDYGAFQGCGSLAVLVSRNTSPPAFESSALTDTSAGLLIYVPDGSVDTYKAASGWSGYASQIKALSELPAE
jgi:hypothetical protein